MGRAWEVVWGLVLLGPKMPNLKQAPGVGETITTAKFVGVR